MVETIKTSVFLIILWINLTTSYANNIIRDTEIENLLQEYAEPLFRATELDPTRINIGIIHDNRINAFVTDRKNMFFHTGLIKKTATPNMLIGIIAHETGHIRSGHHARRPEAMDQAQTPATLSTLLGFGALIAGQADIALALLSGGQHIAQRQLLRFSRIQESSADQAGLQLLEATHQSSKGFYNIMQILSVKETLAGHNRNAYTRSHPLSRDRLHAIYASMKNSRFNHVQDSAERQERHDMMRAKLQGFLDEPDITLRQYQNDDRLPARYATSIAYYKRGNTDIAIEMIEQLMRIKRDNPYFYELKGQILFESGRIRESIAPYEKSIHLAPHQPLLLIALARAKIALEETENTQHAIQLLKQAIKLEPDNTVAYYQLALAYGQINQQGQAELATAERFFLYRNIKKARQHARRAIVLLKVGTPEWIRAQDITENKLRKLL